MIREDFTITVKASTGAFSWLKAPNSDFTFTNLHELSFEALALGDDLAQQGRVGELRRGGGGGGGGALLGADRGGLRGPGEGGGQVRGVAQVCAEERLHPGRADGHHHGAVLWLHLRHVRAGTLVRGQAHAGRQGDRGVHQLHHLLQPEVHSHG